MNATASPSTASFPWWWSCRGTVDEVAGVLRYCHSKGIKVVPRGAGTSLSGGAPPLGDGVLLGMARFNRIREIDFVNRVAVVEPGVTNLAITQAVPHRGFYYAPDPSSQIACTIGGNVAENSGGALPQIRDDREQRARLRDRADERRRHPAGRGALS
jgi:FAD/FMN-containing dehydrogenase